MQLTLRGLDESLERYIRDVARKHGISLNKAALRVLRRGAGLEASAAPRRRIGDRLDAFIGSIDASEASAISDALKDFEQVDEDLWR